MRNRINEEARHQRQLERGKLLKNWLGVLFCLVIISTISNIVLNDAVLEEFPTIELPAVILGLVFNVCYSLILLKLSAASYSYRIAAISGLLYAGLSLLASVLGSSGWTVALTFAAIIPSFIMEFQEYMGHAESVEEFDSDMAEKWRKLWYWYLCCLCATVVGSLLTLIGVALAALVVVVAAIGTVVVAVLKVIYLYSTAKACREYVEE